MMYSRKPQIMEETGICVKVIGKNGKTEATKALRSLSTEWPSASPGISTCLWDTSPGMKSRRRTYQSKLVVSESNRITTATAGTKTVKSFRRASAASLKYAHQRVTRLFLYFHASM